MCTFGDAGDSCVHWHKAESMLSAVPGLSSPLTVTESHVGIFARWEVFLKVPVPLIRKLIRNLRNSQRVLHFTNCRQASNQPFITISGLCVVKWECSKEMRTCLVLFCNCLTSPEFSYLKALKPSNPLPMLSDGHVVTHSSLPTVYLAVLQAQSVRI